jgi:TPR repeat protein
MSLDLTPETPIANVTEAIERLAAKARKLVDSTPPDEASWAQLLEQGETSLSTVYTADRLDPNHRKQPVSWFQSDMMVSIALEIPLSAITVDRSSIASPILKGAWWGPVASIETVDIGECTQLVLTVESEWPYLIRGGDPDGFSCYFLALIALDLRVLKMAEAWLRQSALLGSDVGLRGYTIHLFETVGNVPQGIYFLCQSVLKFHEDASGFFLARVLLDNPWSVDAVLAENLLCRLCANGYPNAFVLLGQLYLRGAKGVPRMPAKAQLLLQVAAIQSEDEVAARLLQTADFTPPPATEEPAPNSVSALDWALACAIAAGGAALAYYAFRRFRRWAH